MDSRLTKKLVTPKLFSQQRINRSYNSFPVSLIVSDYPSLVQLENTV